MISWLQKWPNRPISLLSGFCIYLHLGIFHRHIIAATLKYNCSLIIATLMMMIIKKRIMKQLKSYVIYQVILSTSGLLRKRDIFTQTRRHRNFGRNISFRTSWSMHYLWNPIFSFGMYVLWVTLTLTSICQIWSFLQVQSIGDKSNICFLAFPSLVNDDPPIQNCQWQEAI